MRKINLFIVKYFTVNKTPLELVLLAKNAPLEFEGDSRNSRTARKLREIVEIHAQTAVGSWDGILLF
jgi:hypothetical protein